MAGACFTPESFPRLPQADGSRGFCAWCFDLLMIDGKGVRREPLADRRARLEHLLSGAYADLLRFSEAFEDQLALTRAYPCLGDRAR